MKTLNWSETFFIKEKERAEANMSIANLFDEFFFQQGTTGNPKGATLSHHSILNNSYYVGEILNYEHQVSYSYSVLASSWLALHLAALNQKRLVRAMRPK